MKFKIGIVGHFGGNKTFLDGQTIKTKILHKELTNILGHNAIYTVDTYKWRKKFPRILLNTIKTALRCEKTILILSGKGRNVFIPIFFLLKFFLRNKVHLMIIGGKYADDMKESTLIRALSKKLDGVYVETKNMVDTLEELNFKNVHLLSNFKKLPIINKSNLNKHYTKPYKICTFSRVTKAKGTEDIITAIKNINDRHNEVIYTLDIYGQVAGEYKKQFDQILDQSPNYIQYKGLVDFDQSVACIKDYFMLAFPTYFKGEGFPGTLIDSYSAGVPVLASDWRHNTEIVDHGVSGIIFETKNIADLEKKLEDISKNPDSIISMKENCIDKAYKYSADVVVNDFLEMIQ